MRKRIFRAALSAKRPLAIRHYDEFTSAKSGDEGAVRAAQDRAVESLIKHSVSTVPYYSRLFSQLGLRPNDVTSVADLEKLPVLTKAQMKADPESFISKARIPHVVDSTGGSTGVPLRYQVDVDCYSRGMALLFRGWGFAGYQLGDSMATIAGASLVSASQSPIVKIRDALMNVRHYSSYGMSEATLAMYLRDLRRRQPQFLRGYASSLYLVARFVEDTNDTIDWPIRAIFSTAEVLDPRQRIVMQRAFRAPVFDNYGLNDGGVSAYECDRHDGLHIDFERAVLEVVDDAGRAMPHGTPGRVLATSLFNRAMPFIRYETGDIAEHMIQRNPCACGCWRPRLASISGRTTDYLKLNGCMIGSPQLTVLMGKFDLEQYQIVQTGPSALRIRYRPGPAFSEKDRSFIAQSFHAHVGLVEVDFERINVLDENMNKHKFIINEVCR